MSDVPTGDDPQVVDEYIQWLYEHYLNRMPNSPGSSDNALVEGPQWEMVWTGPFLQELTAGLAMITLFGLFAFWFNADVRSQNALHKPMSFAGALTEHHGKPPKFSLVSYVFLAGWALFYALEHIFTGYVY